MINKSIKFFVSHLIIFLAGSLMQANAVITYPHEWPAAMLKDAVLYKVRKDSNVFLLNKFHLDTLFDKKNILLSRKDLVYELLLSLFLMGNKENHVARKLLRETLFLQEEKLPYLSFSVMNTETHTSQLGMTEFCNNQQAVSNLVEMISPYLKNIDVTPLQNNHAYKKQGYYSYYADKKEDFTITDQRDWRTKQKNIYKILRELKPKSVLDIGANKGWFSCLAEHLGADVIATDIDEFCMNALYNKAKKENLKILPLVTSFEDLAQINSFTRLKSELVMCLALVHHLVLMRGLKLEIIFKTLANLTEKTLILEYIDLEDPRIKQALLNTEYKKNHTAYNKVVNNLNKYARENYSLNTFLNIGAKYFRSFVILDSHPKTRKLIIFSK